jgi:hypothetical protein
MRMPSTIERTQNTAAIRQGDVAYLQDASPLSHLLAVATTILQQALDLVENVLTDDSQLTTPSKHLPGSTIGTLLPHCLQTPPNIHAGKHLRHARDHFVLLTEAIASSPPHILSYDIRQRNTPMESKLHHARDALKEAITKLEEVVPRTKLDTPMTLKAVTPHMQTLSTSFGREVSKPLKLPTRNRHGF